MVYGRFSARRTSNAGLTGESKTPTVLVYGHYDVIAAQNEKQQWNTDPFTLTGKNGYLYGRGTSDNKVKKRVGDFFSGSFTFFVSPDHFLFLTHVTWNSYCWIHRVQYCHQFLLSMNFLKRDYWM